MGNKMHSTRFFKIYSKIFFLGLFLILSGCSETKKEEKNTSGPPKPVRSENPEKAKIKIVSLDISKADNAAKNFRLLSFNASEGATIMKNLSEAVLPLLKKCAPEHTDAKLKELSMNFSLSTVAKDLKNNKNVDRKAFKAIFNGFNDEMFKKVFELSRSESRISAIQTLAAPAGQFVLQPGKMNFTAFEQALNDLDLKKVENTSKLLEISKGDSIIVLLKASGMCLDKDGKFNKNIFNKIYSLITPEIVKSIQKQAPKTPKSAIFLILFLTANK